MQRDEKRAPQKHLHARLVMGMIEEMFFGLRFSIPGFFGQENFGKYFFGWLDLRRDSFWVFKTI